MPISPIFPTMDTIMAATLAPLPPSPSASSLHLPPPQSSSATIQSTIVLHDTGDAILQVGQPPNQQPILVSKTAMILASPVWKAMFSRHKSWAESNASEIPFPDDNIEAMLLVLRIAHLRFREIPGKNGLSYAHLFALAVVCDKYDLVKLVRPFLDLYEWAEPHRPRSVDDEKWEPSWLFVAWTFGFGESFEPLARHLVKNISLDGEDACPKLDEDRYVLEEELPLNYLDLLLKIRVDTLSAMTQACYDILDHILEGVVCRYKGWEHLCRPMILGSYVEFLIKNGLYPVKVTGADVTMSIKMMEEMLKGVKIQAYSHGLAHSSCSQVVNLVERVEKIMAGMPSPLLESHDRHMAVQQAK